MFQDPRRAVLGPMPNSPIGQPPVQGPGPGMPLAGGGMLDPRVKSQYDEMERARQNYAAALDDNPPEDKPWWQNALQTAPGLIMGAAIPGFMPIAAAWAIGSTMELENRESKAARDYQIGSAKEKYGLAKAGLDAAQGTFGSPGVTGEQFKPQVGKVGDKYYWFRFNRGTGQMENTGVEAQGHRDNASGWLARWQQHQADPNNERYTPDEFYEKFEAPSGVQAPLRASGDERMIVGTEGLAGANTRGELTQKELFERRQFVETGMDLVGDMENSLDRSLEILGALESGRIGEAVPLLGAVTQYFDETSALLAAEATAQALENLQIVNLAPVTEKEFAELKKMFADISAGKPANIGRIRASIQRIQRELTKAKKQINRRIKRGLGDDFDVEPYEIDPKAGITLFPEQAPAAAPPADETPEQRRARLLGANP